MQKPALEISVVIPAYREAAQLDGLITSLEPVLTSLDRAFEVIIVDDGSPDDTFGAISQLAATRPWLRGVRLSRNFGKEAALLAGLRESCGRAVITMDADLEHPADIVPRMIAAWRGGAQIVHAMRVMRTAQHGHGYALIAGLATRLISHLTRLHLHAATDFKLVDREVVDILCNDLPERERFFRGLTQWVGFNQVEIPFSGDPSSRTDRRFTLGALVRLAVTALVSFSNVPMHIVTWLGLATLLLSIGLGANAIISRLNGHAVSGFATIMLTLLTVSSFIMISLGVIGIYIAKIYEEIKARPPYIVQRRTRPGAAD